EKGFENFKKVESQIIELLRAGRKVILSGSFAPEFLQMIHPLLAAQGEFKDLSKNLILVIEDKQISAKQDEYQPLAFHPRGNCQIAYYPSQPPRLPHIFKEVNSEFFGLENSEKKARDFIEKRRSTLLKFLSESSLVKLLGHS